MDNSLLAVRDINHKYIVVGGMNTMSNENANLTKVIVPCRFSYLHCWEPNAVSDGDPKYSVSAIIPKSDTETIEKIKRAIEQAKKDSVSKWGGKIPANLKLPLRDGDIDRPEDEAYADSYFFNANSKQAPQVVDKNVQPMECMMPQGPSRSL